MQGNPKRNVTLILVAATALGLAACGTSGLGVIEGAGKPSSNIQSAATAPATSGSQLTRPSVSSAEMRRFLAKQLVENLFIGTQIVGPKREIASASIFGPMPDDSWLANAYDDAYCASVTVSNFDVFQKEKIVSVVFIVHQIGSILSAKFTMLPGECKSGGVPFPEAVEASAKRVSS